jgi:hypothetical protein
LDLIRYSLLIRAPSGIQPVGASEEHGFNPVDQAFFNLKEFGDLPGPFDRLMIEETESKDYAAR